MSCFVMQDRALAAIAESICSVGSAGYNTFGMELPRSLREALDDCHPCGDLLPSLVYKALYKLNLAAYSGRYREDAEEVAPDMPKDCAIAFPCRDPQPWHYQLAKLLDCFVYQCEEDVTRTAPLLLGVREFSADLSAWLVHSRQEYISAPWGRI